MVEQLEWKEVTPLRPSRSHTRVITDCIRLSVVTKSGFCSNACIAPNLIEKLNWQSGTRLKLYRNGKLFMLKPDKYGTFVLVNSKKGGVSMRITGSSFCMTLQSYTNKCRIYDAWVDLGQLLFKPNETV